jgi:hypothetical protein
MEPASYKFAEVCPAPRPLPFFFSLRIIQNMMRPLEVPSTQTPPPNSRSSMRSLSVVPHAQKLGIFFFVHYVLRSTKILKSGIFPSVSRVLYLQYFFMRNGSHSNRVTVTPDRAIVSFRI